MLKSKDALIGTKLVFCKYSGQGPFAGTSPRGAQCLVANTSRMPDAGTPCELIDILPKGSLIEAGIRKSHKLKLKMDMLIVKVEPEVLRKK